MTPEKMWALFSEKTGVTADWEAWSFGGDADTLAKLTLDGTKTATASACPLYALEGESLPEAGKYSVILDGNGKAVCVIKTQRVTVIPFDQVDENQAWKEGEGDRSLAYWRRIHEDFFRQELSASGLVFDEKMPVVCEEFVRVYP